MSNIYTVDLYTRYLYTYLERESITTAHML